MPPPYCEFVWFLRPTRSDHRRTKHLGQTQSLRHPSKPELQLDNTSLALLDLNTSKLTRLLRPGSRSDDNRFSSPAKMSDTSKQYLPTPQPQQQQPQPPATVPSLPSSSSMNSNGSPPGPPDGLTCQWAACRDRCESPEALYVSGIPHDTCQGRYSADQKIATGGIRRLAPD